MAVLTTTQFADQLCISSVSFRLMRNQQIQNLGNGEVLSSDMGPAYWEADIGLSIDTNIESARVQALLESLSGTTNAFMMYDPRKQYPASDSDGTQLGISIVRVNTVDFGTNTLSLKGLPAGYQLSVGDFLSFEYGTPTRVALHRITQDATADGSGITPTFTVAPQLRPGAVADAVVDLRKPSAKMVLLPGSLRSVSVGTVASEISFAARQTLRAD